MKVEFRSNGTLHISGYVNAVERDSRVLPAKMAHDATGDFVEQIRAGTFARSLHRRPDVHIKFNHERDIGSVGKNSLSLREDAIGLYASADPIECVEIKQHSSVLHPATKWLKEHILSGKFAYDKNKLLEINFSNARCTEDTNLNKYVNKKRSAGKVDMVVALINAVHLLQQETLEQDKNFVIQYSGEL